MLGSLSFASMTWKKFPRGFARSRLHDLRELLGNDQVPQWKFHSTHVCHLKISSSQKTMFTIVIDSLVIGEVTDKSTRSFPWLYSNGVVKELIHWLFSTSMLLLICLWARHPFRPWTYLVAHWCVFFCIIRKSFRFSEKILYNSRIFFGSITYIGLLLALFDLHQFCLHSGPFNTLRMLIGWICKIRRACQDDLPLL